MRKVIFYTLLIDQLTKFLAVSFLEEKALVLIPGVFQLTLVKNPGAIFGLPVTAPFIFVATTLGFVLIIFFLSRQIPLVQVRLRTALALQVGGAIGNLIDRFRLGYVIDFLDFRVWPVFNLADVAIVAGVVLFCWEILHLPEERRNF